MANLKTSAGSNNIILPYKGDTGSDGNIMPLHIYKKLFPEITNEQLAATKSKNILLKMHNKITITQLGTCTVEVEHTNNRKKCRFFVGPSNGQALLGMPDTDVLNIIKINIHAIGTEQTGDSDKCCTNMHIVQEDGPKQERVRAEKCYTNMDSISKSNNKTKPVVNSEASKAIEYFLSGPSYEHNKKRVLKLHSKYIKL